MTLKEFAIATLTDCTDNGFWTEETEAEFRDWKQKKGDGKNDHND